MTPYYDHAGITIFNADCLDVLPTLAAGSVDLVLTDPPYYRVKGAAWDRQWSNPALFLDWMRELCQQWRRVLKPNGSLYVFASPDRCMAVEGVIRESFNVLNSIRWVKEEGWHKKAEKEALRSYLSPWEGCIFAEQFADEYEDAAKALHKSVYSPIGRYIQQERERAGYTRNEVEIALGYVSSDDPTRGTALCYRWEEGSSLPTKEAYERLRAFLNDGDYEYLRRDYEELRRPFNATMGTQYSDVWFYPTVQPYEGKHECEKPLQMIADIVSASSRPGAVILDCFAGSGVVGEACHLSGRSGILIEQSARWADKASQRLEAARLGIKPKQFEQGLRPLFNLCSLQPEQLKLDVA